MVNHITRTFSGILWGVAATICVTFAAPAYGQSGDYREEYKRYNEAMQSGDLEAAAAHGRAAWQAAEAELGDDGLTGILAYNYGQLILFTDTAQALGALKRAEELRAAGLAELPADELRLYLAYAEFISSGKKRREANALREELALLEESETPPSPDTATMWHQLALSDLENSRFVYAGESADKAAEHIAVSMPSDYRFRATALIFAGIANLNSGRTDYNRIETANERFASAYHLFPTQKNLEEFDGVLAQAIAWSMATRALYSTKYNLSGDRFNNRTHYDLEYLDIYDKLESEISRDVCNIEWALQDGPQYPNTAARKGHIGAALIGFSLGEDLKVHNPFVFAEVPTQIFGQVTREKMKEWRLAKPVFDHPDCREDRVMVATFIF